MDIRNYIIHNFKQNSTEEIKDSIEESIKEKEEITLPGLGVFFELLWTSSNSNLKQEILETLKSSLD